MEQKNQHFLVVIFPGQGHINPGRSLARRLARSTGCHITFSTAVSAHRQMFPSLSNPNESVTDGPLTYIPYSDGFDHGFQWFIEDASKYNEKFNRIGPATLSSIMDDLANRGMPVTCAVYSVMLYWVKEIADTRGIPSSLYWVQPATVFGIYYHYCHGYKDLINSHLNELSYVVDLPHLPPFKIGDLPGFFTDFTDQTGKMILESIILTLELSLKPGSNGAKTKILVNSFEELEPEALKFMEELNVIPIGPHTSLLDSNTKDRDLNESGKSLDGDLFKLDEKCYMEWLDTKPEKSVVYVSFGSIAVMNKRQLEEMQSGLRESARPYLWVVRENNRGEGKGVELEEGENSMIVEWCDQVRVLAHPSIACFVMHCGWNSTLESLSCGVPMVVIPQWNDQFMIAKMAVECWGVGVRGEVNGGGVLEGTELKRCLEIVMGDGERGMEIRKNSKMWSEKARGAVRDGGSSDHNLKDFLRCK